MMDPISNPTKTLQIDRPPSDVNEAIAFIPALSKKYKFAKANPALQAYTLSGAEPSTAGAYIDIHCSFISKCKTGVTLEVRRKKGAFGKTSELSLANQHIDTVFNLLSDSLALEPSKRSRILSEQANKKTASEHRARQAKAETRTQDREERRSSPFRKRVLVYLIPVVVLVVVFYFIYRYFIR